jgi:pilus assembly protein Flp/PilA
MCKKCSEDDPMKTVIAFLRDETAATSIEYALLASGIALAIVVAVNGLGTGLATKYSAVKTALD